MSHRRLPLLLPLLCVVLLFTAPRSSASPPGLPLPSKVECEEQSTEAQDAMVRKVYYVEDLLVHHEACSQAKPGVTIVNLRYGDDSHQARGQQLVEWITSN